MVKYEITELDDTCGYWIPKDVVEVEPIIDKHRFLFWTWTTLDFTHPTKDKAARQEIYRLLAKYTGRCRVRRIDSMSWHTVWENNKWVA